MGYMHISNVYRDDRIFMFKRCYAMEKIHGCVKKGTKVLLSDKTERPVEEIVRGDVVFAFDESQGKFVLARVKDVIVQESDPRLGWMEVTMGNGRIVVCTVDHPFLTTNRGWVIAEELTMEDDLVGVFS